MTKAKLLSASFKPMLYRLSKHDNHYNVVIIGTKLGRPSQRLTLHANKLKLVRVSLWRQTKHGKQELAINRHNLLAKRQELRLHSAQTLFAGDYEIDIDFTNSAGKLTTSFDNSFSDRINRSLFPCIDEPESKAPIELS